MSKISPIVIRVKALLSIGILCSFLSAQVLGETKLPADVIGLDVRSAPELLLNPSNDSVHMPISDLSEKALSALPDKNAKIYIFCQSGGRSARGAALLKELGYTQVEDIKTWKAWNALESTRSKR